MLNYANWQYFDGGDIPADFSFPDLDQHGKPIEAAKLNPTPMFLGPKGQAFSETLKIPEEIFERTRQGKGHIYVWGWTTYRDVFWFSPAHQTKYCNEIQVTGLDVNSDTKRVTAGVSFRMHSRHNCIDNDCR